MRRRLLALVAVLGLLAASPALAGHHRWDFTEIYSNASGTVQYMEMFSANTGESGLGSFGITAGANSMSFVTNLPGDSQNTWVLVATSNFASLPGGITPDYIIPGGFFSTAGGTLNYAAGADIWAYGAVPTDGVLALQRNGSTATNSPRNFPGATGSVNLDVDLPGFPKWGLILLVGALLLAASGLLRRREGTLA